jgi:hypothetical protein
VPFTQMTASLRRPVNMMAERSTVHSSIKLGTLRRDAAGSSADGRRWEAESANLREARHATVLQLPAGRRVTTDEGQRHDLLGV